MNHEIKILNGVVNFIHCAIVAEMDAVVALRHFLGSLAELFHGGKDHIHQEQGGHIAKDEAENTDDHHDGSRAHDPVQGNPVPGQKMGKKTYDKEKRKDHGKESYRETPTDF